MGRRKRDADPHTMPNEDRAEFRGPALAPAQIRARYGTRDDEEALLARLEAAQASVPAGGSRLSRDVRLGGGS